MWLFNFFLAEEKKPEAGAEFYNHALLHHQAVLHLLLIASLPIHCLLLLFIILLLLLLILLLLLQVVWKASGHSFLSCRDL